MNNTIKEAESFFKDYGEYLSAGGERIVDQMSKLFYNRLYDNTLGLVPGDVVTIDVPLVDSDGGRKQTHMAAMGYKTMRFIMYVKAL